MRWYVDGSLVSVIMHSPAATIGIEWMAATLTLPLCMLPPTRCRAAA